MPDQIDVEFLKNFRELILSQIENGKKFIIVCGGGKTNRRYNEAVKQLTDPSTEDLDWIGIATIGLNAEFLRVVFKEHANKKVVFDLTSEFSFEKSIIVGGAYKPGHSSDADAVWAAKTVHARKIINLFDQDYAYDSDPKKNPNAKRIEKISWPEYRKIIPTEWVAKLDSPFDPVASKMAEEENMEVIIMNGRNLENLNKYLNGEGFVGTVIQ